MAFATVRARSVLVLALASTFAPSAVVAQHSGPTAADAGVNEARAGVAALGKEWSPEVNAATAELYAALHRRVDSSGIRQIADISYGPHRQQTLDLFVPDQGFDEPGPVLVYLHGGGLTGGDKVVADTAGLIYANVGKWIARVGGIGVSANFRQLPDAKWPSGPDDVRRVLDWVKNNVGPYGGDPNTVVLMGNSVGAMHVASYLFYAPAQLDGGPGITAAILSSGGFAASTDDHVARAYFGAGGAASLVLNLVDSYQGARVPILLWSGEYDVPFIESGVARLHEKLCAKYGDCPMFVQLAGHNHVSHVMSIDSADTSVTNTIIRFYHSAADNR